MMKIIALMLLASGVKSFVVVAPCKSGGNCISGTRTLLQKESIVETNVLNDLESAQHKWKEEAERLHAMEHAVETDPDLANLVEAPKVTRAKKHYIEKEAHRHDSLLKEIEHALETDPDLANIVTAQKSNKRINQDFIEKEAHVHDSLLSEIEHAIDNDPDL